MALNNNNLEQHQTTVLLGYIVSHNCLLRHQSTVSNTSQQHTTLHPTGLALKLSGAARSGAARSGVEGPVGDTLSFGLKQYPNAAEQ
jgi:hypothetical protein